MLPITVLLSVLVKTARYSVSAMTENRQALEDVAQYLLANETMDRKEFLAVFGETEENDAPAAPVEEKAAAEETEA